MDLLQQVTQCFDTIKNEPFNKQNHLNLISILQANKELMQDELEQARVSMANLFHLTEQEWDEWLQDISKDQIDSYFQLRLLDSPCVSHVWLLYCQHQPTMLPQALKATIYDIQDNINIIKLSLNSKQDWLTALTIPHLQIDQTFNDFSSFISQAYPEQYEQEMLDLRKLYTETKKLLDLVELKEIQALQINTPEFWISYLHLKGNKIFKNPIFIQSIFERAVYNQDSPSFIPVWTTAIDLFYELNHQSLSSILQRFIKRYPNSGVSWSAYISNVSTIDNFNEARERIMQTKILPDKQIDYQKDKKPLIISIVSFIARFNAIQHFEKDLSFFFDLATRNDDDTVCKIIIQLYDSVNDLIKINEFLSKFTSTKSCAWIFKLQYEIKYNDLKAIFKFLKGSISQALYADHPMEVLDEVGRYALLHYDDITNATLTRFIKRTLETLDQQPKKRKQEPEEPQESQEKKSKTQDAKPRDREHLTLLVKNLPNKITESQLETFFKNCEPINQIKFIQGENAASVEFGSTQLMLALLTRNYKKINGNEILVEQVSNTTVWVTNFPPGVDQSWLEELFAKYGKVVSVRLPSLKTNAKRRFCYIEYASSLAAADAVLNLNSTEYEGYKLVVKISNPDAKTHRTGAIEEQREVFIAKVDFMKTDVESLQEIFSKYGEVEKIHMPLNDKNKKLGRLHDGYGFVNFVKSEDAAKAVEEMNGTEIDGRIIDVKLAVPRSKRHKAVVSNNSSSKNPSDVIKSKTLNVHNVASTVSVERLKNFLEQVGPIRKIDLNTANGTAIVEYENVSEAGLASMKLSGQVIDGSHIQIGEFATNRRQRRLLQNTTTTTTVTHTKNEKKDTNLSNDDFKKMLLG